MNLLMPPQIFDGGYWYVVPVVISEDGGLTASTSQGAGWCAWYGSETALVRCPVIAPGRVAPANDVVLAEKPYGRVGGA
jgi:hypothetical protein